jgi:hypothetical protein
MDEIPKEGPAELPVFIVPMPPERAPARPFSYWLKKFFACNPFYLVSAAMLLYGVYQVSFDSNFAGRETLQLTFNFSSLEVYELLVVAAAIFLARRCIWYDSVLLVGLENLLALVPFILISQAALLSQTSPLSQGIVLAMCMAGVASVLLRFWSLKQFFKELNLPRRALVCGIFLLVINVVLPLVYRHLHESKVGTKPTEGAAYELNRYTWLLLVPTMLAMINLLPRALRTGNLLPQRWWLPLGFFGLWLAGSGTHVYCLSYVYNFDWEYVFIVPVLWAAAWTVFLRLGDLIAITRPAVGKLLMGLPLAAALLGLGAPQRTVFAVVMVLNLGCYLALFLKDRRNVTALHLFILSAAILTAGLIKPVQFAPSTGMGESFGTGNWLVVVAAAYGLYWIVRSRNPKAGVWGGLMAAIVTICLTPRFALGLEFGIQAAFVVLLTHSLRWVDGEHKGARGARILGCIIWFLSSLGTVLLRADYARELVYGTGGWLLVASILTRFMVGNWRVAILPATAILVLLISPAEYAADKMQATPTGILAVGASFLLFGLGTLAALTKPRWHPSSTDAPTPIENEPTG